MHRFFLTNQRLTVGSHVDLAAIGHQLRRVLRLHAGDAILLLDGRGCAYTTEIDRIDASSVRGVVTARTELQSESHVELTLYQCSLKADKFEWVLQKGTELGVMHFAPVISARSIVRPADALLKKYDRWRAVIREAAEQSGRGRLPQLQPPLELAAMAAQPPSPQECCLVPWEEAGRAAAGLGDAAAASLSSRFSLFIGPEGGLEPGEITLLQDRGWQVVSLGPRILRAETAALAAVAILLDRVASLGEAG